MQEGAVVLISVGMVGIWLHLKNHVPHCFVAKFLWGKRTYICTLSGEICGVKTKFVRYLLVLCLFI